MRLIDAKVLTKRIKEFRNDAPEKTVRWFTCNAILSMIGDEGQTPTIDPETLRPTGRWVYDDGNLEWACSECLGAAHVNLGAISGYILSDYCPNCGAKMEG